MILTFAAALTKELDAYTPCILEKGKVEQRKINRRLFFLIEKILTTTSVTFSKKQHERLVKALKYAAKKHQGVYRKDGITPYFLHPLEVVLIIIELNILDFKIIVAAILHDVVEDTDASLKDVGKNFGAGVKNIVDLVSKKKHQDIKHFWERIRHDVDLNSKWRVIVLRFADRIHYFMTSNSVSKESMQKHLHETSTVFPSLYLELVKTLARLFERGTLKNKSRIDEIPKALKKRLLHEIQKHT
jgi:(p)ppGpp synthase/HD superfamily hydrolase